MRHLGVHESCLDRFPNPTRMIRKNEPSHDTEEEQLTHAAFIGPSPHKSDKLSADCFRQDSVTCETLSAGKPVHGVVSVSFCEPRVVPAPVSPIPPLPPANSGSVRSRKMPSKEVESVCGSYASCWCLTCHFTEGARAENAGHGRLANANFMSVVLEKR